MDVWCQSEAEARRKESLSTGAKLAVTKSACWPAKISVPLLWISGSLVLDWSKQDWFSPPFPCDQGISPWVFVRRWEQRLLDKQLWMHTEIHDRKVSLSVSFALRAKHVETTVHNAAYLGTIANFTLWKEGGHRSSTPSAEIYGRDCLQLTESSGEAWQVSFNMPKLTSTYYVRIMTSW